MLYIHQFPDWTNFRYNHKSVVKALGKCRMEQGHLLGLAKLVDFNGRATEILAKDIAANFAIDGITANADAVQNELLLRNDSTRAEVKNHLGMLQKAEQPLTEERIFNWHASLGQNKAHHFREEDSEVVFGEKKFQGVSAYRLQAEMERFINWFETDDEDGVIKAAISQFWFLTIRPFDDANGRIARMLSAMLLARCEGTKCCSYALNAEILQQKEEYFQILAKCQAGNGDLTEWILWFLARMSDAIQKTIEQISSEVFAKQHQAQGAVGKNSAREQKLFEAVFNGTLPQPFTVKEYAALVGTSHDTALRDLQSLIEQGTVKQNKGGRSTCYSLTK